MREISVSGCERAKNWNSHAFFSPLWYFYLWDNETIFIIAKKKAVFSLRLIFFLFGTFSVAHARVPPAQTVIWYPGKFCVPASLWTVASSQRSRGMCNQMKTKPIPCGPHSSQLQKAGTLIWVAEFLVKKASKFMWSEVNSLEVNLKHLISWLFMFSSLDWLWAPCMKEKEKKKSQQRSKR